MATFQERLEQLLPQGYEHVSMRRSVQTVVMFEGLRIVQPKLASMRPFQRKIAFYQQLTALLNSLDFILPHHRKEILWRTGTSKEAMNHEVAWKRARLIERELSKIAEKVKPYVDQGMSHEQACNAFVQELYEKSLKDSGKSTGENANVPERSPNWEHSHNNMMLAFRLYYKGDKMDPDFPPPKAPVPIIVPSERPSGSEPSDQSHFLLPGGSVGNGIGGTQLASSQNASAAAYGPNTERQRTLAEVREHLELLKEFEGVIPQEDLDRRKRELFLALPSPPPPANGKRYKPDTYI